MDLQLNIPLKMKKKELRQRISSCLNMQSGKNRRKISTIDKTQKSKEHCLPWSPPKACQNASPLSPIIIQSRNPEKGVRIIKMSEFNKANDKPELKENYQDLSFISRKIRMICLELLKVIRNGPNAKSFLEPVDWEGLDLPNYPQIIKKAYGAANGWFEA